MLKEDLEKKLSEMYKGYKFKVTINEDLIEILHNYEDKIGDLNFINEIFDLYEELVDSDTTSYPIIYYDFLDEINESDDNR